MRNWWTNPSVLLVIGLAVLLIGGAGAVVYVRAVDRADRQTTDDNWSLIVPAIGKDDHVLGSQDAPIQLIVYSDFSCQYCKSLFNRTVPELLNRYGAKIAVAYRNFPIYPRQSAAQARMEAQVAECVYRGQGANAYWSFSRMLFNAPGIEEGLSTSTALALVSKNGGDSTSVRTCLENGDAAPLVDDQTIQGSIAGLVMSPSIVIKSAHRAEIVSGDYYSRLTATIDSLLASEKLITQGYGTK